MVLSLEEIECFLPFYVQKCFFVDFTYFSTRNTIDLQFKLSTERREENDQSSDSCWSVNERP